MIGPPKKLPRGFRMVWETLSQADERAPSRRSLARTLEVSSLTLHRLLVTGDVPDLATASVREQRAWTRTVARIAHRLGASPRPWLEATGLVWDDSIASLVAAEERKPRGGAMMRTPEPDPQSSSGRDPDPGVWTLLRRGGESAVPLRVGIGYVAGLSPASPASPGPDFLPALTRRILLSLTPRAAATVRIDTPSRIAAELRSGRLDLAVGIWDAVATRNAGAGLVPIPGLTVPLRGFGTGETLPSWREASFSARQRFLVEAESPAADFLRVHCERTATQIVEVESNAAAWKKLADGAPDTILVLDGWSAWSLFGDSGAEHGVHELVGLSEEDSLVRLTIGLPPAEEELLQILTRALSEDFFGANAVRTADLYASLLAGPASDLAGSRTALARLATGTRLSPIPSADPRFFDRIAAKLGDGARTLLPPAGPAPPQTRQAFTSPVLPPVGSRKTVAASMHQQHPPQCQSCSVSLAEFGGASDHYCRYCSDEHGHLRPLPEVRAGIRRWMLSWQEGVQEDDVDDRVTHFLRAMPAWAGCV